MHDAVSPRSPQFARSAALVDTIAALSPSLATFVGLPGHDDSWDDFGPEGHAARAACWAEARADFTALPETGDPWDALCTRVVLDHCESQLDAFSARDHLYDLNSIASTFQIVPLVLDTMPLTTIEDTDRLVLRLSRIGEALRTYRASLSDGLRSGHVVARRQVETALRQGRDHAGADSCFTGLARRANVARGGLDRAVSAAVVHAQGAYAELCGFLESEYLPRATLEEGVGAERYERAARHHLGMRLDLAETYAWGFEEIRRLETRMALVAREFLGRGGAAAGAGATAAEAIAILQTAPEHCASDVPTFLDFIRGRQAQALSQLEGSHFDVPPGARAIEVRRAPKGAGPIGAYYMAPSPDFGRAGAVCYQLEHDHHIPTFDEVSTAYHEGFPGHHLQVSVQIHQAERLSAFQRLIAGTTGYAEGWALYAEQLMDELGFLEKPEYVLGMLVGQIIRAWRVVIDIGLHLGLALPADAPIHAGQRWSYAVAVDCLHHRGFMTPANAASEVARYLGWPGQAIAYKVGQRVIAGLRDDLRGDEGPTFDLRRFHERVLEVGSIGLDLLVERLRPGASRAESRA